MEATRSGLPPGPGDAAPRRALIAEDDQLVRLYLVEVLAELGMVCSTAVSFAEAIQAVTANPDFVVAFVDLGLPDRSGLELIAELRRRAPTTHIIIQTGYGRMVQADDESLSGPHIAYLAKPYTPADVAKALAEAGVSFQPQS